MKQRNTENTLRKLHSLSGIIPLGVFLCVHMLLNYSATWGIGPYNATADFMVNLPYKVFLESFVIFLPLLFHAGYGIYIALDAKHQPIRYPYVKNWCFLFQRISGFIALLFVLWHVYDTRFQVAFGAEPGFGMMAAIVSNPIYLIGYIVGIVFVIFHFTNGVVTFLISWGITISSKSQKTAQYVMWLVCIGFWIFGIRAILAFA